MVRYHVNEHLVLEVFQEVASHSQSIGQGVMVDQELDVTGEREREREREERFSMLYALQQLYWHENMHCTTPTSLQQ